MYEPIYEKPMAELDVQPKKSNPWWLWLILAVLALALLFFFLRNRKEDDNANNNASGGMVDSATVSSGTETGGEDRWGGVDFDVPETNYEELADVDINVRGNESYAIYSVDETILFESDQSEISQKGAEKLKAISGSVGKRFSGGDVRVYGHTDAEGNAGHNKELAEKRAEAVRGWLVANGSISDGQISLHPVGESQPVASNSTEAGKQQNRRVEIVARAK